MFAVCDSPLGLWFGGGEVSFVGLDQIQAKVEISCYVAFNLVKGIDQVLVLIGLCFADLSNSTSRWSLYCTLRQKAHVSAIYTLADLYFV